MLTHYRAEGASSTSFIKNDNQSHSLESELVNAIIDRALGEDEDTIHDKLEHVGAEDIDKDGV